MFLNLEYREEQDCQLAGLGMFFGRYVFFWLALDFGLSHFFWPFHETPTLRRTHLLWMPWPDPMNMSLWLWEAQHTPDSGQSFKTWNKTQKNKGATVLIKCALKHITARFRLGNSEIWNHHFSIAEFLCSTSSHLRVLHADAAHDFGPTLLMIATHCLVTTSWDG